MEKALKPTLEPAAATNERGIDGRKRAMERIRPVGLPPTHTQTYKHMYKYLLEPLSPTNIAI